jgi:hypothetical protein
VGLAYHLADIYVPELQRLVASSSSTAAVPGGSSSTQQQQQQSVVTREVLLSLLSPFLATLQRAGDTPLLQRVVSAVFEPLVEEVSEPDEADDDDGNNTGGVPRLVEVLGPAELAGQLFELGGDAEVRAKNREALYGLSRQLEKAAKKRAKRERVAAAAAASAGGRKVQQVAAAAGPAVGNGHAPPSEGVVKLSVKKRKQQQRQKHMGSSELVGGSVDGAAGGTAGGAAAAADLTQGAAPSKSARKAAKQARDQLAVNGGVVTDGNRSNGQGAPHVHWQDGTQAAKAGSGSGGKAAAAQQVPSVAATPVAAATAGRGGGGAGAASTAKKSVRINLKKNLYFAFGGPVPDPLVRTPPASRSQVGFPLVSPVFLSQCGSMGRCIGTHALFLSSTEWPPNAR